MCNEQVQKQSAVTDIFIKYTQAEVSKNTHQEAWSREKQGQRSDHESQHRQRQNPKNPHKKVRFRQYEHNCTNTMLSVE